MQAYKVTDKAGRRVAGQRVKSGDILHLTEAQAEHELRIGTIVLSPPSQAAPVGAEPTK